MNEKVCEDVCMVYLGDFNCMQSALGIYLLLIYHPDKTDHRNYRRHKNLSKVTNYLISAFTPW